MNQLSNQVNTISSLEVAEMMEVSHRDILRKLEGAKDRKGYIQILAEAQMGVSDYFIETTYKSEGRGRNGISFKKNCSFRHCLR